MRASLTRSAAAIWIFTESGFVSVVKFDPKYDKETRSNREKKSWGSNPMLVRARLTGDLEQIRPFWSRLKVYEDTTADYSARAIVPGTRLSAWISHTIQNISYDSHFKEAAKAASPGGTAEGSKRYSAYMKVWGDVADLQISPPYGGKSYLDNDYSWGGSSYSGASYASGTSYTSPYKADEIATSQVPAVTNGLKAVEKEQFSYYADDAPFDAPITVMDMCDQLLDRNPLEVYVDLATPYAVYDLWALADSTYNPDGKGGDPVPFEDLLHMLSELQDSVMTTFEARNSYVKALESLTDFSVELTTKPAMSYDDYDDLLNEVHGVLATTESP